MRNIGAYNITCTPYPSIPPNIKIFLEKKKGTQPMYELLIQNESNSKSKIKWMKNLNLQDSDCLWKNIYGNPFKTTKDSKLLWFQYRINHRILTTFCTFCHTENETIVHYILVL